MLATIPGPANRKHPTQSQSFAGGVSKGRFCLNLPSAQHDATDVAIPYRRQAQNNHSQLAEAALDFLNQESDRFSLVFVVQKEVD